MADVNPNARAWAQHLKSLTGGGGARVMRYYDDAEEHHIDVFSAEVDRGLVAATIGLMEVDQSSGSKGLHTEIVMDCRCKNRYIGKS